MAGRPQFNQDAYDAALLRDAKEAQAAERGLDAVPPLGPTFDYAQQSKVQLEPQTEIPPPSETRPTSYAKTIDPLGTAVPVNNQSQEPPTGKGSEMVEQDKPEPEPSNTTPEGQAAKASAFNQAWQNEQARADTDNDLIRDAHEAKAAEAEAEAEAEIQQEQEYGR